MMHAIISLFVLSFDVNVVKNEFYFVLLAYLFGVWTNHILRSGMYAKRTGKRY